MQLFCRHQRKTVFQRISALHAETGYRARAGSIGAFNAGFENGFQGRQVLLHDDSPYCL